jgi:hypothetical protein
MRSRSQQDNASEKSSRSGSKTAHNANVNAKPSSNSNSNSNSNVNVNSNSGSNHPRLPDKDVEAKLPETNLKSDDKSENNATG